MTKQTFFQGKSEMSVLMQDFDWASTDLGDPATWPINLHAIINVILTARFPMFLWWGKGLIQFYNDDYRQILGNPGKHPLSLGQKGEECWAEMWHTIEPLIKQVLEQGEAVVIENQLIPIYRNATLQDVYWTFSYSPVWHDDGTIKGVLVICTETTRHVNNVQDLNHTLERLKENEKNLKYLIQQAPIAIGYFKGLDLIIEAANERMLHIWGKPASIIHQPLRIALPEIENQGYLEILHNVYTSGEAYFGHEQKATLEHDQVLQEMYFDFVFQPLKDKAHRVTGIIAIANDVTETLNARKLIEQSENRLRQVVMKSPFIMLVLSGPDMVIEIANQALYNYWNKTEEQVLGLRLLDVLPELKGQKFPGILQQVFEKGKAFGESEVMNYFETDHGVVTKYVSYLYEPIIDETGVVTRILVAAEDMTRMVEDRIKIKTAEENLRLSLQAADLGRFDMDLINGTMFWDERCRELFGIYNNEPVTYEHDFVNGLHPEDKDRIVAIIDNVFNKELTNGDYDVEYRTVGFTDRKIRWVRAKGKAFFDTRNKPVRFIGSVLDITDQKMAEIRRNDFFAMASHELKTPLTSIKSSAQLLLKIALEDKNEFRINSLTRINKSADKMIGLIQGFLDKARLDEGKLELNIEPFELDKLLEEIAGDMQFQTLSHHLAIISDKGARINADYDKITQVIENLISNALKYSPQGGKITLGYSIKENFAEIFVTDEGIGISEQDKEKLFQRFYRVQNQSQKIPGFGIGLYLVSEILRLHKSQIFVDSAQGKGSRFYFHLPVL